MGLETAANFLADLEETFPTSSDFVKEGDNHFRKLKEVLKNTFPGFIRAIDSDLIPMSDTDTRTLFEVLTYLLSETSRSVYEEAGTSIEVDATTLNYKYIVFDSESECSFRLPAQSEVEIPVGFRFFVRNRGAGGLQYLLTENAQLNGDTIDGTASTTGSQYSWIMLENTTTTVNRWVTCDLPEV